MNIKDNFEKIINLLTELVNFYFQNYFNLLNPVKGTKRNNEV